MPPDPRPQMTPYDLVTLALLGVLSWVPVVLVVRAVLP